MISLTGLFWAFDEVRNITYQVANAGNTTIDEDVIEEPAPISQEGHILDAIHNHILKNSPEVAFITLIFPRSTKGPYRARAYQSTNTIYDREDYFFDQKNRIATSRLSFKEKNNGDKINALTYDLHVGAFGGIPTKIIYSFGSLIIASLPVTGFLIWIGKKKNRCLPIKT